MTKFNRHDLLVRAIFLCVIIGIFFVLILKNMENPKSGGNNIPQDGNTAGSTFNENAYEQAPRTYLLGYIKSLNLNDYDKEFASGNISAFDGKKIYAVYYMENDPYTAEKNYNHPDDENGKYRGGIIAFIKNDGSFSIVWESREYFIGIRSILEFQDIDNDGRDELVLTLGQGARLLPAYYIYKWSGQVFNLINPHPQSRNLIDRWMAGNSAELKDIDGDKIFEVVTTNEVDSGFVQRTYKFNGSNYYLWRETPIKN